MVMLGRSSSQALLLVLLMFSAAFSGCFGENESTKVSSSEDAVVTPEILVGGVFQGLTISAEKDLSAFIPYLIMNKDTGFVQNSTVIDLSAGESVLLSVLAPPRADMAVILLGEYGRDSWPVRSVDESWKTWYERGGDKLDNNPGIIRVAGLNNSIDTITHTNSSVDDVVVVKLLP